jgi:hypothetical protein
VIPNITRGGNVRGVLSYLLGPGRRDEHASPHLVGGSAEALLLAGGRELAMADAADLARFLDEPRLAFGEEVVIAERDQNRRVVATRAAHVWHCSLSLHPDEPDLEDGRWQEIAEQFVSELGFAGEGAAGQCRWVAVRHGRSHGGSDHVHLVVQLVAENGTKASVHYDQPRAQDACRRLERAFDLREVEARGRAAGERGLKAGELAADRRRGLPVGTEGQSDAHPDRTSRRTLERVVRACGAAARDEQDFVNRVREEGLLIRARFAAGDASEVVGYSVALRAPVEGEPPIWFGGGRLSRELTLPRLRENWPELDAESVVAVWRASATRRPGPRRVRTRRPATPDVQVRCARELAALREQLLQIPPEETATWAHAAREAAGVFAAWSLRTEPQPGPLAETCRVLARSAQLRHREVHGRRWRSLPAARHTTALLLAASPDARAALNIFRQLSSLSTAIADMHQAVGDLQRARELQDLSRRQLATVTAELQAREVRAHIAGSQSHEPRRSLGGGRGDLPPGFEPTRE